MDNNQISVNTFDKLAVQYQQKYMDFDFYCDTYNTICDLLTQPSAKILELACGPGNITKYLLSLRPDYQIHGTDLAPNMVALAAKNNPTATFSVLDSRHVGQVSGRFDAIVAGFCTPYLSPDEVVKLIAGCRSKLNCGGFLYLSTMEDEASRSGLQTSSAGDQVYTYYHQYTQLEAALLENGFELIKVERKQFPVESGDATTDLFIYAKAI